MAFQELPGAMQKADTNIVLGLCISNLAAPSLPILTSERRSRCAGGWQRWQGCSAPHFRAMERAPGRHHGPEPTSHVPITKVIKPQHHLVIWQITFPVIKCNIATRSAMHLGEGWLELDTNRELAENGARLESPPADCPQYDQDGVSHGNHSLLLSWSKATTTSCYLEKSSK